MLNRQLDTLQKRLAKIPLAVKIAVKVRNQANKIIGFHLSNSHIPGWNGENEFINSVSQNLTSVIDAGANQGDWSEYLLSVSPSIKKLYCFEPGESAFKLLKQSFGGNPKIELYQKALSDRSETLEFYEETEAGEASSFVLSEYNKNYIPKSITSDTIDLFMQRNNIESIDLLKIDCQGFDFKVLQGASESLRANKIKWVQFEYSFCWLNAGATLKAACILLNGFGYNIYYLTKKGLMPFYPDYYGEYFQYGNFVGVIKSISPLPYLR